MRTKDRLPFVVGVADGGATRLVAPSTTFRVLGFRGLKIWVWGLGFKVFWGLALRDMGAGFTTWV